MAFFESEIRIPQRIVRDDTHQAAPNAKVAVSITRLTESERDQLKAFEDRYPDMKFVNRIESSEIQAVFFTMMVRSKNGVKLARNNSEIAKWATENHELF